jgi:hypothetical protein
MRDFFFVLLAATVRRRVPWFWMSSQTVGKGQGKVPFTGNRRLNALYRFAGRSALVANQHSLTSLLPHHNVTPAVPFGQPFSVVCQAIENLLPLPYRCAPHRD